MSSVWTRGPESTAAHPECSAASELPVTGSRRPNTAKASPECRTHGPRGHHTHCPHRRPRPSQAEGDPREAGARGGRGCWLGGSGGGGHRGRLWRGCDIVGSCRLTGGQAAGQQALWPLEGRPAKPRGGHAARQHQSQGGRPTGPRLPGQREGHPRTEPAVSARGRSHAHSRHCRSGRGCRELQDSAKA